MSTSPPTGSNSDISEPSVWPPTPSEPGAEIPEFQNTSGTSGELPPEIARLKWNWGAFGLSLFWMFWHRMPIAGVLWIVVALALRVVEAKIGPPYSYLSFGFLPIQIYLGFNGHRLAWRKRRYDSLTHYFTVETIWRKWAVGVFTSSLVVVAAYLVVSYLTGYYTGVLMQP
jgi:hypothetical protein